MYRRSYSFTLTGKPIPNLKQLICDNKNSNFIFLSFVRKFAYQEYVELNSLLFVRSSFLDDFSTFDQFKLLGEYISPDWGFPKIQIGRLSRTKLYVSHEELAKNPSCDIYSLENSYGYRFSYIYAPPQGRLGVDEIISQQIEPARRNLATFKAKYSVVSLV
jgi:hypothetical protein